MTIEQIWGVISVVHICATESEKIYNEKKEIEVQNDSNHRRHEHPQKNDQRYSKEVERFIRTRP